MAVLSSILDVIREKRKIIFNSIWVTIDKVLRMLGGLIVGVWVARYLGPQKFGSMSYASSIISLCLPLINMGMNNIVLTDLIRTERKEPLVATSILMKLISGSLMIILIYFFSFTLENEVETRFLLLILSAQCILQCSDVFDVFYQSRTESKRTVIAKSTAYIFSNIIKVIGILNGLGLYFFGIMTVIEMIISSLILCFFYFKVSGQDIKIWSFNKKLANHILSRSWPLIVADVFISLYMRLDQIMIKNLAGNTQLGIYSAAVRISEMHYFLAGAICISVYPSIVKLKDKGEDAFLHGYQRLFNILFAISFIIALLFTFISKPITHFLYGEKFPGLDTILSVHIWTGIFVYLGIGMSNWFVINNYQRYVVINTVIGLCINAALNFVLIPRYFGLGASIATLVAQVFAVVLSNLVFRKLRPIFKLQVKAIASIFRPSIKNYI